MSEIITKRLPATFTLSEGERAVIGKITTTSVDRDGDVMLPSGADLADFEKSPTVFYNHNYSLPIGRAVGLKISRDGIDAKTLFAKRPDGHTGQWLPDEVLSLFKQRVIRGFSIGFQPVDGRPATEQDRKAYGADARYIFTRWKLLEYSVAPLPANQDALSIAVASYDPDRAKLFPGVEIRRRQLELMRIKGPSPTPRLDARQRQQDALRAGG